MRGKMRRLITLACALLLVVAACGGDTADNGATDQGDQVSTTQPGTTQPDVDDGDDSGSDDDSGDSKGSGSSTATVTIGDQTYNFSSEGTGIAQCLTDLFGIFSVQLRMIDDSGAPVDGNVSMAILHEDTDPEAMEQVNAVRVEVDDEGDWVADSTFEFFVLGSTAEPGKSQVDSVEFDGRTVRGTATFLQDAYVELGEPVTGTFEATCGEERTV